MKDIILFKEHRPPGLLEVKRYFSNRNINNREAEHFYFFYELRQWKTRNGRLINNWKTLAGKWIAFALRIKVKNRK